MATEPLVAPTDVTVENFWFMVDGKQIHLMTSDLRNITSAQSLAAVAKDIGWFPANTNPAPLNEKTYSARWIRLPKEEPKRDFGFVLFIAGVRSVG